MDFTQFINQLGKATEEGKIKWDTRFSPSVRVPTEDPTVFLDITLYFGPKWDTHNKIVIKKGVPLKRDYKMSKDIFDPTASISPDDTISRHTFELYKMSSEQQDMAWHLYNYIKKQGTNYKMQEIDLNWKL